MIIVQNLLHDFRIQNVKKALTAFTCLIQNHNKMQFGSVQCLLNVSMTLLNTPRALMMVYQFPSEAPRYLAWV